MTDPILRLAAVQERVPLSTSAIYAAMARGDFPKPIKLTGRAVGWRESTIEAWLADRESSSTRLVAK